MNEQLKTQTHEELWGHCVDFHGHACPGLAWGYQASLYAIELLGLSFSHDEEIVCISENDACCVDAIQVVLGCSVGKGNLLFHMTGKLAFSFYNRDNGKSVRLVGRSLPEGDTKQQRLERMQAMNPEELFDVKPATIPLPEKAMLFGNRMCDGCGESTAEAFLHLQNGKMLCPDCYRPYNRFQV